jgi:hypothetical protein
MSVSYGGSSITFEDGSIVSSGSAGFKNKIINGGMVINQRYGTTAQTNVSGFVTDRFQVLNSSAGTVNVQTVTTAPADFSYSTQLTANTADASVGSTDSVIFYTTVEGYNTTDLNWGTVNARTVTLSFWVRSSLAGTYSASIVSQNGGVSFPFNYTISSSNTWTQITQTITGPTSGTFGTTNDVAFYVEFALLTGSTYQGTPNAWSAGNWRGTASQVNWMATSGNTFNITGIQLEKGTTASSFEFRSYTKELVLCQRYLWVYSGAYAYARGPVLNVGTTSTIWYFQYPTTMRAAPSLTLNNITSSTIEFANYTNGAAPTYSSAVFNESSIWGGCITLITTGSTFTIGGVGNWRWTGAPSANFTFSAEI